MVHWSADAARYGSRWLEIISIRLRYNNYWTLMRRWRLGQGRGRSGAERRRIRRNLNSTWLVVKCDTAIDHERIIIKRTSGWQRTLNGSTDWSMRLWLKWWQQLRAAFYWGEITECKRFESCAFNDYIHQCGLRCSTTRWSYWSDIIVRLSIWVAHLLIKAWLICGN